MREANDLSRRTVVAGVAMMAAGSSAAKAREPDGARPKGPRVWLDMDQKELDDAYDQAVYAPNSEQVALRRTVNSAAVRARLGFKRVAYGPTPIEMLDIYATKAPNAPVMVFIHGGAWRAGSAKDNAEAAELFVNAGAHYVVLDFANVMELGGSLFPMVEQVRRGVAWVYKNAASFGGDPDRIYIAGRSSGSHLGGVVLITDWQKDFGLPADLVKGALLSSGMYDLKPVRLSKRGAYV
ncbi:MAG TPA: alpha/beta hydrolase, partial [Xanthobacteraceae bacterium]|nr:alpha/beta hydrolase [Xanthobacteraceae bacterium]